MLASLSIVVVVLLTLGANFNTTKPLKDMSKNFLYLSSSMNTINEQIIDMSPKGLPHNGIITSQIGYRVHPITKEVKFHRGIDIAGNLNDSILSTSPGKVIFAGWKNGYGNTVILEHDRNVKSLYAHLNKITVKEGEILEERSLVGLMGKSGHATGVHVHYEVIK